MERTPFGIRAYRLATTVLSPVVPALLSRRRRRGKEDLDRVSERLGHSSIGRPDGKLIWIHGASNGECLSALPLIEAFVEKRLKVLMTSGTVT